ncbi:MAG: hypothetical protein ACJ71Q_17425 [Terriglobales bacterium]
MNRLFAILMIAITGALLALGTAPTKEKEKTTSPEGTVQAFYDRIKSDDYHGAYSLISPSSNVDFSTMYHDIAGRDGSLKTLSHLQRSEARVIAHNDNQTIIRASLDWATAVGTLHENRDLRLVSDNGNWQIVWPKRHEPNLPPQVIPVTYLRWDIIHSDSEGNEWGAQNAESPHVRITSMNAVEREGKVIILGELVNDDTVPGYVDVEGILIGKDGEQLGEETSFDKISHVLLPKEVTPFRIDFDGVHLNQVKKVTLNPTGILVPASADPVIGVLHQQLDKNEAGHSVLKGELVNQSGELVNIPQVLATYYDAQGRVVWISDGYVDQALRPQIPVPFAVSINDDIAANVHSYRVVVNHYAMYRPSA